MENIRLDTERLLEICNELYEIAKNNDLESLDIGIRDGVQKYYIVESKKTTRTLGFWHLNGKSTNDKSEIENVLKGGGNEYEY